MPTKKTSSKASKKTSSKKTARKTDPKPVKLERNLHIYLKQVPDKYRGVFCTKDIRKGEEIERTPALVLNARETNLLQKTILRDYVFGLGAISKKLRQRVGIDKLDDASCLIMGVTTYCNHDDKPNAEIVWEEHEGTLYHTLCATRAIPKNTEICTSYGKGWFDDRNHMSN